MTEYRSYSKLYLPLFGSCTKNVIIVMIKLNPDTIRYVFLHPIPKTTRVLNELNEIPKYMPIL